MTCHSRRADSGDMQGGLAPLLHADMRDAQDNMQ